MLEKSPFGRTGHLSTRALFGSAALSNASQAEADAAFDVLEQYGVNHVDTAASYGDAELRIGDWIARHGKPFFLATKTGERTAAGARRELQQSLQRLHVDQIDLWQLHHLVDEQEWQTALGPGGALEAAVEARQQGLVRFIGVTGHGLTVPHMHLRALERFDFDSVLLPFNYLLAQYPDYLAGFTALLKLCQQRQTAVQIIKSIARGPWGADQPHTHNTWYVPLEEQADIDLAVGYILGRSELFLITAGDLTMLPRVLDAASRYTSPPDEAEMQDLLERQGLANFF